MIGATLDGNPIELQDWQAEAKTDHGDTTCTGRVPRWTRNVEQGAPLVLWRQAGDPLWVGELVAPPRIDEDWLHVRAEGDARRLGTDPLLYRLDGGDVFVEADSEPHEYVFAGSEGFDLNSKRSQLTWKFGDGNTAYAVSDRAGWVLWLEGAEITRYSLLVEVSANFNDLNLQVLSGVGPSGALTVEGTHTLALGGAGATATYATTLATPRDLLCIRANVTGAFTPAARRSVKVNRLRVYGRTTSDTFTLSDVVADVAALAGFATDGIEAHTLIALPLYWPDQDHAALLSYMAELADWLWMVRAGALVFRPYGFRTWECSTERGSVPNLEPEPQANTFTQPFRALSGRLRYATAAAVDDPFPGDVVPAPLPDPLEDAQPDNALALAVAQARVAYEASYRESGTLDLGELRYRWALRDPNDIEPGDLLDITDRPELGPQRITAVTYRHDAAPSVSLGESFNLMATLVDLERDVRRRRRRRGRKAA